MSNSETKAWLAGKIRKALQLEAPEANEIVNQLSSLTNTNEISETIRIYIPESEADAVVNEYLNRLGIPKTTVPKPSPADEGLTPYMKGRDDPQSTAKKTGKKKNNNKWEVVQPAQEKHFKVQPTVLVYKKTKKKQTTQQAPVTNKNRVMCECQARVHALVNNCLRCGRIVCEKEGAGPCLYCSNMVSPYGQPSVNPYSGGTKEKNKMTQRQMEGLQKANEHLQRLLSYDQTSAERTTIYDDQSDYFESNKWMNEEEKARAIERQEAMFLQEQDKRMVVSIDLAGRQVVQHDQGEQHETLKRRLIAEANEERMKQIQLAAEEQQAMSRQMAQASLNKREGGSTFINPTASINPTFIGGSKTGGKAPTTWNTANSSLVQTEYWCEDIQIVDFEELVAKDNTPLNKASPKHYGIVEGYYGRVWSFQERSRMIEWMLQRNANLYIWAPKDDLYHRKDWAAPFTPAYLEHFQNMTKLCQEKGAQFGIAIHPMEINFNDQQQITQLHNKVVQAIVEANCSHITILFDDIDVSIPVGKRSLAFAQAELMNDLISVTQEYLVSNSSLVPVNTQKLKEIARSIQWTLCPTYYHNTLSNTNQGEKMTYLKELHEATNPAVTFMWTGLDVISARITTNHLKKLKGFWANRKVLVWDNTPVNDYRQQVLFVHPYEGRAPEIGDFVDGVVLNPMDAIAPSQIQIGTAFSFFANPATYQPEAALQAELALQLSDDPKLIQAFNYLLKHVLPSNPLVKRSQADPYSESTDLAALVKQVVTHTKLLKQALLFTNKEEFGTLFDEVDAWIDVNSAYLTWLPTKGKSSVDNKIRQHLCDTIRRHLGVWEARMSDEEITLYHQELFGMNMADPELVKEVDELYRVLQTTFALDETNLDKKSGDFYQVRKKVVGLLVDGLHRLEAYLVPEFFQTDSEAFWRYFNRRYFGLGNTMRPRLNSKCTTRNIEKFKTSMSEWRAKLKALNDEQAETTSAPMPEMAKEEVDIVPGLKLIRDWLTVDEEKALMAQIDEHKWETTLKRRQYGYNYHYWTDDDVSVPRLSVAPVFPDWLQKISNTIYQKAITSTKFDQCIVNEYEPGQGIVGHFDHVASFEDNICSISLGSMCVMTFTSLATNEVKKIRLDRRSLLLMTQESRYKWKHAIEPVEADVIDGISYPRDRRVSITLRSVTKQGVQHVRMQGQANKKKK